MAKKKLSVQRKIENYLLTGKSLTPAQIRSRYKVANPHNPVYEMESKGYIVDREYRTMQKGNRLVTTVTYSLL